MSIDNISTKSASASELEQKQQLDTHLLPQLNKRERPSEKSARFKFSRMAVYVAAVVALTSGDFLTGALSQEAETLHTIWSATPGDTIELLFAQNDQWRDDVLTEHPFRTIKSTLELSSGLVMPPDSATSLRVNSLVPADLTQQFQSQGSDSERPTVPLLEASNADRLKQLQQCTGNTPGAPGLSVMEKYMREVASRGTVVASIGSDLEVLRLSQATPTSQDTQEQSIAPVNDARMKEVVKSTGRSNDPDR